MCQKWHVENISVPVATATTIKTEEKAQEAVTKGDRDVTKGARPGSIPGLFDPVFSLPGSVMGSTAIAKS